MMNKDIVLAFDLSKSNTGYAVFKVRPSEKDFMNKFKIIELDSINTEWMTKSSHPEKLEHIANSVIDILNKYDPATVAFEDGFVQHNIATRMIFEVRGVVRYITRGRDEYFYAPQSVKKEVCGTAKGKKKHHVRKEVSEIYPKLEIKNNDESDAMAVGITYFRRDWEK